MDPNEELSRLQRPRHLIRHARFGVEHYNRKRDLPRLLPTRPGRESFRALYERLLAAEAEAERLRRSGGAGYLPMRHAELLIALMAEAHVAMPARA